MTRRAETKIQALIQGDEMELLCVQCSVSPIEVSTFLRKKQLYFNIKIVFK